MYIKEDRKGVGDAERGPDMRREFLTDAGTPLAEGGWPKARHD